MRTSARRSRPDGFPARTDRRVKASAGRPASRTSGAPRWAPAVGFLHQPRAPRARKLQDFARSSVPLPATLKPMSASTKPHSGPDDPGFTLRVAMGFLAPDWNRFMTRGLATRAATGIWPRSTAPTTLIVTCSQGLRNPLELEVDGSDVEVFAERP